MNVKGPMRRVIAYTDCSGTMELECGHIKGKRPEQRHPARTECTLCLPLDLRRLRNAELEQGRKA